MNTILKTLTGNVFWILFFLFVATSVQARNEYLQNGTNTCDQGSWEAYNDFTQRDYKTGTSNEYTDTRVGFRYRKSIGSACSDEFIAEQEKQIKLKTQMELIKSCRSVPRISPPPPAFAELIGACLELGVIQVSDFEKRDNSISYWIVLKDKWKQENPDRPIFEEN